MPKDNIDKFEDRFQKKINEKEMEEYNEYNSFFILLYSF